VEGLGVPERKLDTFLEPLLRFVEPADVVPADIGHLHHHFAHGGGLHALQGLDEIVALHAERFQYLGRDRAFLEIELGHDPSHRLDCRLAGKRGDIRTNETMRRACEFLEVDFLSERHAASVDRDDLPPASLVRNADHDLAVEPARPPQRLVDCVWPVGGGDDDDVGA